jgi:hypothetical protein
MSTEVLARAVGSLVSGVITLALLGTMGCGSGAASGSVLVDASTADAVLDGLSSETDSTSSQDGASLAESSTDGCAPSTEATNDGGCVAVVPAGARVLAMEVNPPTSLDYGTQVDVAAAIGVSVVPVTLPWSTLESAALWAGNPRSTPAFFPI